MKAFLIAVVGLVVIAFGARLVLTEVAEPTAERYRTEDVRLDEDLVEEGDIGR